MRTSILSAAMLLSLTEAQGVINLIQPLWEIHENVGGITGNLSSLYAASIVEVKSEMTTYAVGCNSQATSARLHPCQSSFTQLYTQGSKSLHFTYSNTETDKPGETGTYSADYTYASTLAPIVTSTFVLLQIEPGSTIPATTVTQPIESTSSPYAMTTWTQLVSTEEGITQSYSEKSTVTAATWYQIPITAGAEKLSAAATGSSSSSTAKSTSSSAAGAKATNVAQKLGVLGAVVGGVVGGLML